MKRKKRGSRSYWELYAEIAGICFLFLMVGFYITRFVSYFRIRNFDLIVNDQFVETKGLFGTKKIFYRDIGHIKFQNLPNEGGNIPTFRIYIDIFSTTKTKLSLFC